MIIQWYTGESLLEKKSDSLRQFLGRMGVETRQGAIGIVVDRDYLEIKFPLEQEGKNGGQH